MVKILLIAVVVAVIFVHVEGLYLGVGGVSRTGSSWPPYPGAGQGYWARRAGLHYALRPRLRYRLRSRRSAEPEPEPLYLGLGGVVGKGNITPRTGPSPRYATPSAYTSPYKHYPQRRLYSGNYRAYYGRRYARY